MDRHTLVRAHFDAYSDLLWATDLEPKFRQYDLSAAELKEYREAWNRHAEARDWDWWQETAKGMSEAELRKEIAECQAEIAALRKEGPGLPEAADAGGYHRMLKQYADAGANPKPPEKERGPER
jgi:hypothetical protein